ncbi:glycosyltransferase [uncultured Chryseobacterium sp.]|uniref:glycosyltransferase n=1 Tax=uncultured Chryseobacterium sp. TaxID=259322 RepID=UPI002632E06F|nr:glycosyltransferase [uncultured Chryseobacterium sp.]
MKVTFLTTSNSRKAGGLFYSVRNLAINVNKIDDISSNILSCNDEFSAEDLSKYEDLPMPKYSIISFPIIKKLGFSLNIHKVLKFLNPDIVHQQGIWMYHSNAANNFRKRKASSKKIITPRGMMDEWLSKNSSATKKLINFWYEQENLQSADCFHALNYSEYCSIRKLGFTNPIAIIPNGTTIIEWERSINHFTNNRKKTLLFLGRIHSKKGITQLIEALGKIKIASPKIFDKWSVKIAGWEDEGDLLIKLKQKVIDYDLNNDLQFVGSLYDAQKETALKTVDAFILPSFSEGMPMSILEAWSYGLPVIMTEYCNLPEGFKLKAAHQIDTNPKLMAEQLITFLNLNDEELFEMGQNGKKMVHDNFSWSAVAEKTATLYKWLLDQENHMKPDFVYLT